VSIRVDAGQIVTVIGLKGAGKTTLLSALMSRVGRATAFCCPTFQSKSK
jgi:ABC-type branched-subunit amino acid transport system ATPase component